MKGINTWSYHPYCPFLTEVGDPYICRVVPHETAIHVEWLPTGEGTYRILYRKRGEGEFILYTTTREVTCDITGLSPACDYEFFIETDKGKSRVRLAHCGASVGTTVNYLHPEDTAYAFSGQFLCSPSLVRHPDGFLLASMDLFRAEGPQNLTLIFRSDDEGATWHYQSELMPCFWGKMFIHRGELYMLACSTEYGDLLIGRSTDGGKTFSAPVALLRGSNGKEGYDGVHKNPQNVVLQKMQELFQKGDFNMAIITIVGAGMMGSALAFPARENGNEVRLVGTHLDREIIEACKKTDQHPKFNKKFPAGLSYYHIEELETALNGADMVIGGVSSFGVDWFGDFVLPKVAEKTPVLSVTKGLVDTADGKLLTYPDVWEMKMKEMGLTRSINAIGGPCTSYELVAHDQTEVSFCGKDIETLKYMKSLMQTDYYHISPSTDVVGIESAVALKNGYALGIALTIGLNQKAFGIDSELHFNSQAAVFGQAVKEMYRLLAYQGAATLENMSVGYGDLYVTVYGGRTRLVGILLGRGLNIDEAKAELNGVTLESLVVAERVARAVRVAAKNGKLNLADFPLLMHVDEIIIGKQPVNMPWEDFTFEVK